MKCFFFFFFSSLACLTGTSKKLCSPLYVLCPSGLGADVSRPPCRKAKDLRKERRLLKEHARHKADGVSSDATPAPPAPPTTSQTNQPKLLEDFISESPPNVSSSHSLEVSGMWCKVLCSLFWSRKQTLALCLPIIAVVFWGGMRLVWSYAFFQSFFLSPSDFTMGLCVQRAWREPSGKKQKSLPSSHSTK